MRLDFCRMTSSTGGTGALTCAAQTGYPLVSEAFTGTRFVEYTIVEYTSSAKTQPSKAETGIGSYVTSTEVLTRTKVLSTWDATDYLPKFGTATAPTALSFGTTSANIDIMVGPMAAGSIPPVPFQAGAVGSVNDGLGMLPMNFIMPSSTSSILTNGRATYFPALIAQTAPISKASVRVTTGATAAGGTPSTFSLAIYEVGSNGLPGKRLIDFGSLGRPTTTGSTLTATLGTPVFLSPGWYFVGALYVAGTDTGTPALRAPGAAAIGGSPIGGLLSSAVPIGASYVDSQTALNDPATTPNAQNSGNAVYPSFWFL